MLVLVCSQWSMLNQNWVHVNFEKKNCLPVKNLVGHMQHRVCHDCKSIKNPYWERFLENKKKLCSNSLVHERQLLVDWTCDKFCCRTYWERMETKKFLSWESLMIVLLHGCLIEIHNLACAQGNVDNNEIDLSTKLWMTKIRRSSWGT